MHIPSSPTLLLPSLSLLFFYTLRSSTVPLGNQRLPSGSVFALLSCLFLTRSPLSSQIHIDSHHILGEDKKSEVTIRSSGADDLLVSFQAFKPGKHKISVRKGGVDIIGSPFKVDVPVEAIYGKPPLSILPLPSPLSPLPSLFLSFSPSSLCSPFYH